MKAYLDGTTIEIEIPLVDELGQTIVATAVEYAITDGKGVEKLAKQSLSGFTEGSVATITITDGVNTMPVIGDLNNPELVFKMREPRVVNLFLTTADGDRFQTEIYAIERANVLIEGVNSFQSYAESLINAMNFVGLEGWNNATKVDRISALLASAFVIRNIQFDFSNTDMRRISYKGSPTARLTELGQDEFLNLDVRFKEAIAYAQVLEANELLTEDEERDMVEAGVTGSRIGETQKTWNPVRLSKQAVCKQAMKFLRPYLGSTSSLKIERA